MVRVVITQHDMVPNSSNQCNGIHYFKLLIVYPWNFIYVIRQIKLKLIFSRSLGKYCTIYYFTILWRNKLKLYIFFIGKHQLHRLLGLTNYMLYQNNSGFSVSIYHVCIKLQCINLSYQEFDY